MRWEDVGRAIKVDWEVVGSTFIARRARSGRETCRKEKGSNVADSCPQVAHVSMLLNCPEKSLDTMDTSPTGRRVQIKRGM